LSEMDLRYINLSKLDFRSTNAMCNLQIF
jgi:hypothetical protein